MDDENTDSFQLRVDYPKQLKKWIPILAAAMGGGAVSNLSIDGFTDQTCQDKVDSLQKEFDDFKASELEHWKSVNAALEQIRDDSSNRVP